LISTKFFITFVAYLFFINFFKTIIKHMDNNNLNCLIIHKGYQPYLKYNLKISSKFNNIFLIGDSSVEFLERISDKITFINIEKYSKINKINKFKNSFTNYSTNSFNFEWFCFERIFIIKEFMKEFKLDRVFHIDSDNILLTDINELIFTNNSAYIIPPDQINFRMTGSIHSALIDSSFCDKFINLFEDIYVNKSKFNLIKEKIDYHNQTNSPGGICDMTLYYLLDEQNIITPQNLLEPIFSKSGEEYIFMNNYSYPAGFYGDENYLMSKNRIKIYFGMKVNDLVRNKTIKLANIHFQGKAKVYLNRFTKYKLFFGLS